jgi:hypothetical protein
MNLHSPFARKIAYLVAIVALLPVLSYLSRPASLDRGGRGRQAGGKLSQLRDAHRLSQANLGEIDPASETMKLATLGMRGIAVNLLWSKVLHYQKVKDFTSLSATLEQLTKLQPNFVRVWIFQGWNLAYNISVEFDDYHDRYHWVIRGIDFIKQGTEYNRDEPTLLREIGRTISQKMGRSDERVLFRRLFKQDDDFHGNRPLGERDSWLVGKEWFQKAVDAVEIGGHRMKSGVGSSGQAEGASPLIYLSEAPLCQIHYAGAIEEEGTFDRPALAAWQLAEHDWTSYGSREIQISGGQRVRLGDYEYYLKRVAELKERLAELAPGVAQRVEQEKRNLLTRKEREALEKKPENVEQAALLQEIQLRLQADPLEIAARAPQQNKREAIRVATEQLRDRELCDMIDTSRNIVNYGYWLLRCQAEQAPEAINAHKLLYQAEQAQREVELEAARKAYEEGFAQWRKVLDRFPALIEDGITGAEMVDVIKQYRRCLKELDEEFPRDFILADILQKHEPPSPLAPTEAAPQEKPAARQ